MPARSHPRPGSTARPAARFARESPLTSSCARCGCSEPEGSWRRTRAAPRSGSLRSLLDPARPSPLCGRSRRRARRRTHRRPRQSPRLPRAGSRRRSAGRADGKPGCRSRAETDATNRRDEIGVDGTRADEETSAQGQAERRLLCALRARMRSHGLSTPRQHRAVEQPPPEPRGRRSPPVEDLAIRSCSGREPPASGSWPSSRTVVSASTGMRGA